MFKKILMMWMALFVIFLFGENNKNTQQNFISINKKMIEGKVFYSRFEGNSFYIMSRFKNIDPVDLYGEVVYTMMSSPKSISGNMEHVSYWIRDGKIVIYDNGGGASRLTLIAISPDRWILLEEEDGDGDGKHFGFKKTGKETWYLKKPRGYPALEKCKPVDLKCFVEAFKFPV